MNDIAVDPTQVRGFADDVALRLDTDFRSRIAEIRELMGSDHFTLGTGRAAADTFAAADYSGRGLGFAMGSSITDGLDWLTKLETGLETLATGAAVFSERLVSGDIDNAENLYATTPDPTPDRNRERGGGGGSDEYQV